MNPDLSRSIAVARVAIDMIKAAGIDESDPDFATLVESECDALERVRRVLRSAREAEANAKTLKHMADDLDIRRERFLHKSAELRRAAQFVMEELGIKRLPDTPDMTVTLAPSPRSVIVDDPEALHDRYIRVTRAPDKAAIKAGLEANDPDLVGVARLSNGGTSLRISTK